MATTDRGSARIAATDSTGATLIGDLIITGANQRAIAASDEGGLTLIAAAKELWKLCSHRPVTVDFLLEAQRRMLRISNQSLKSRRVVACAVSAQDETNFGLLSTALFHCFLVSGLDASLFRAVRP
jgi:hypothetical protein